MHVAAPRIDEYYTCESRAKILSEAGIISLLCTMPLGHEGLHYDAIFCMEWK